MRTAISALMAMGSRLSVEEAEVLGLEDMVGTNDATMQVAGLPLVSKLNCEENTRPKVAVQCQAHHALHCV